MATIPRPYPRAPRPRALPRSSRIPVRTMGWECRERQHPDPSPGPRPQHGHARAPMAHRKAVLGSLCPRFVSIPRPVQSLKVLSNLRRDLPIGHLVDGVNSDDPLAEPFTLQMVFELQLCFTRP